MISIIIDKNSISSKIYGFVTREVLLLDIESKKTFKLKKKHLKKLYKNLPKKISSSSLFCWFASVTIAAMAWQSSRYDGGGSMATLNADPFKISPDNIQFLQFFVQYLLSNTNFYEYFIYECTFSRVLGNIYFRLSLKLIFTLHFFFFVCRFGESV